MMNFTGFFHLKLIFVLAVYYHSQVFMVQVFTTLVKYSGTLVYYFSEVFKAHWLTTIVKYSRHTGLLP